MLIYLLIEKEFRYTVEEFSAQLIEMNTKNNFFMAEINKRYKTQKVNFHQVKELTMINS